MGRLELRKKKGVAEKKKGSARRRRRKNLQRKEVKSGKRNAYWGKSFGDRVHRDERTKMNATENPCLEDEDLGMGHLLDAGKSEKEEKSAGGQEGEKGARSKTRNLKKPMGGESKGGGGEQKPKPKIKTKKGGGS